MRIFCILIINFFIIQTFSQDVKVKLNDLKGKAWSLNGLNDLTYVEKYEKSKILLFMNDKQFGTEEYYLSDTIVSFFDPKRIGKVKQGKYLVRRLQKNKKHPIARRPMWILEIKELGPDRFVIKNIKGQQLLEFKIKE
jgi:hypothetical protein